MTSDATTYLKYANLQMAAEALYTQPDAKITEDILTAGNHRSSMFTGTQAQQFVKTDEWTLVSHQSNTTTGFSGTLFRNSKDGELVMCFRSTEFIDAPHFTHQDTNAFSAPVTIFRARGGEYCRGG